MGILLQETANIRMSEGVFAALGKTAMKNLICLND